MLNITNNTIESKVVQDNYSAFNTLRAKKHSTALIKILLIMGFVAVTAMFLPWTQNIRSKGYVTTLLPDQRPQTIQALIGGKIEKWYIREGQVVQAGDTILKVTEVKEEYLDPELLDRTQGQIDAKIGSADSYEKKAQRLEEQYQALLKGREIKLTQNEIKIQTTKLKIESDSMELVAIQLKQVIAEKQLVRIKSLYDDGIKSLTDLEAKRMSVQEANAKATSLINKINAHRNELDNLVANKLGIINEYADKLAKSSSDRMSALSSKFDSDASVNKLKSQFNAYEVRQKNYFITSPIDGMITESLQNGIGEIIKNGDKVVNIVPTEYQLAVETYVEAFDMPLLAIGEKVRIQFDGWPAIVFSGWPNNSSGTFGGKIFAIDNDVSKNGKYRILVAPDEEDKAWPEQLRVGGGANTITLLKDVRVGYEIWRQLNGFPPDFYEKEEEEALKTKAPLRKFK